MSWVSIIDRTIRTEDKGSADWDDEGHSWFLYSHTIDYYTMRLYYYCGMCGSFYVALRNTGRKVRFGSFPFYTFKDERLNMCGECGFVIGDAFPYPKDCSISQAEEYVNDNPFHYTMDDVLEAKKTCIPISKEIKVEVKMYKRDDYHGY